MGNIHYEYHSHHTLPVPLVYTCVLVVHVVVMWETLTTSFLNFTMPSFLKCAKLDTETKTHLNKQKNIRNMSNATLPEGAGGNVSLRTIQHCELFQCVTITGTPGSNKLGLIHWGCSLQSTLTPEWLDPNL